MVRVAVTGAPRAPGRGGVDHREIEEGFPAEVTPDMGSQGRSGVEPWPHGSRVLGPSPTQRPTPAHLLPRSACWDPPGRGTGGAESPGCPSVAAQSPAPAVSPFHLGSVFRTDSPSFLLQRLPEPRPRRVCPRSLGSRVNRVPTPDPLGGSFSVPLLKPPRSGVAALGLPCPRRWPLSCMG